MEASLKRRFQYMQPDLIPLAVRPPPPPAASSPDHHHLLPKRRLDDFPAATSQRHDRHAYAGGQLIMKPNLYHKLQATTSTSSSIFYPNSLFSSTCTSFNPLHGESSVPPAPPPASLTPSTTPPVFTSGWAPPAPLLALPYLLPAGHVVGGGTGPATTSSLPPLVELGNNKEQVLGAADDKARARKAVNEKNLQRRRRIREKLISLETLVPATRRRLNKAAMLEEACKYIKFLEAQVKALSSMRRPAALPAFGCGHPGSFEAAVPRVLEELSQEQVLEMMVNSEKTQAVLSEKGWCVVSLEQAEMLKSALQSLLLKQKLMASSQMTQHLHLGHHLQPY